MAPVELCPNTDPEAVFPKSDDPLEPPNIPPPVLAGGGVAKVGVACLPPPKMDACGVCGDVAAPPKTNLGVA